MRQLFHYSLLKSFAMATALQRTRKFIDIGANLTDPMYQGIYHGKSYHQPDLDDVLKRSYESGVDKIIVTGGSLQDCCQALDLVRSDNHLYCTVGVHPTRCGEFKLTHSKDSTAHDQSELDDDSSVDYSSRHLDKLLSLATENRQKVVAIGECGLDYDRLHFCDKPTQLKYFEEQLFLSDKTGLPLFLHCRNAFNDFTDILRRNKAKISAGGVVHSFDGNLEEMNTAIEEFGLYIGVNGCSLKSNDNLEVVKNIPIDRLLLETDAPWCEIRPSHASHQFVKTQFPSKKKERWEINCSVKSRNEPRNIQQVLEVVAAVKGIEEDSLANQVYINTTNLFKLEQSY